MRATAMIPTRSARVTESPAMRGSSLRRGRRRPERDAVGFRCCAGVAPPVVSGRLRDANGDEWAMGVSFPFLSSSSLSCTSSRYCGWLVSQTGGYPRVSCSHAPCLALSVPVRQARVSPHACCVAWESLCQMNSARCARSSFPILVPLHGQTGKCLPKGESLLDGKQMTIRVRSLPG